jgi:hypothetical protein
VESEWEDVWSSRGEDVWSSRGRRNVGQEPIGVAGVGRVSNMHPRDSAWEVAASDVWSSVVGLTMMERG